MAQTALTQLAEGAALMTAVNQLVVCAIEYCNATWVLLGLLELLTDVTALPEYSPTLLSTIGRAVLKLAKAKLTSRAHVLELGVDEVLLALHTFLERHPPHPDSPFDLKVPRGVACVACVCVCVCVCAAV